MNNQKNLVTIIVIFATVVILGAVYYFLGPSANDRIVVTNTIETVANKDLDFSFSYESGESALSSMETLPNQFADSSLLKMYVLTETKALEEFNKNKEKNIATDAPPAISILVFNRATSTEENIATTTASTTSVDKIKQWAEANNQFTNINLAQGNIDEIKIDGATAIHYVTDGLYKQNVYVVRYGKKMYLFVGQSMTEGDYMQTSFENLIKSILFE